MNYLIQNGSEILKLTVISGAPIVPDGMVLLGLEEDCPEIMAQLNGAKAKSDAVQAAYDLMNKDVLDQMAVVFGTTNPDSANANKQSWDLMKAKPALFVPAKFATDADCIAFADTKIASVEAYAVWRETRIDAFRAERSTILGG